MVRLVELEVADFEIPAGEVANFGGLTEEVVQCEGLVLAAVDFEVMSVEEANCEEPTTGQVDSAVLILDMVDSADLADSIVWSFSFHQDLGLDVSSFCSLNTHFGFTLCCCFWQTVRYGPTESGW